MSVRVSMEKEGAHNKEREKEEVEGRKKRGGRPRLTVLRVKRARDEDSGAQDAFVVELPKRPRTMRFGDLSLDDKEDDKEGTDDTRETRKGAEREQEAFCETKVFRFVGTVDAGARVEDVVALCEQRAAPHGRPVRGAWRSPLVTQESTRARLDRAAQHAQARRVQARLTATFLARSAATQQAARIVDIAGAHAAAQTLATGTPSSHADASAVYDLYVVSPPTDDDEDKDNDTKQEEDDDDDDDDDEEEPRLRVRLEAFSETLLRTTGLYELRRGGGDDSDGDDGLEYADGDEDVRPAWDDPDSNDEDADCNTYPDESSASDGSSSDDDCFGYGDADDTRYSWYCDDRDDSDDSDGDFRGRTFGSSDDDSDDDDDSDW